MINLNSLKYTVKVDPKVDPVSNKCKKNMNKISFTKKAIDDLPLPDKNKRSVYYDTKAPTLAIRVTGTGHKSFAIIRKVDGRKGLIKAEIARRNLNYIEVADRLKKIGVNESPENISNKIGRGTFGAIFMMHVLIAIDCHDLHIGTPPRKI